LDILARDGHGGWITAPQHNGIVHVDADLRAVAATEISPRLSPTQTAVIGDTVIGLATKTPFRLGMA
jgi:hypothetical protein